MKGPSQCGNSNGGAERRCGHTDSLGGAGRSGEASERGPMAWREGGEWVRRCEGATSTGSFTSRGVRLCASLRWRRVGRRWWWWCTGVWSGGNGKVNGPLVWKMWTRKLPEQQWTDSFARREKQRVCEAIEFAVSLSPSRFSLWFVRGNNERHSSRCEKKTSLRWTTQILRLKNRFEIFTNVDFTLFITLFCTYKQQKINITTFHFFGIRFGFDGTWIMHATLCTEMEHYLASLTHIAAVFYSPLGYFFSSGFKCTGQFLFFFLAQKWI